MSHKTTPVGMPSLLVLSTLFFIFIFCRLFLLVWQVVSLVGHRQRSLSQVWETMIYEVPLLPDLITDP